MARIGVVLFGAGGLGCLPPVLRPGRLVIDSAGATYTGSLGLTRRLPWSDIENVVLFHTPRSPNFVVFRYRAGHEPPRLFGMFGGSRFTLPAGWTLSSEVIAGRLNAWRTGV